MSGSGGIGGFRKPVHDKVAQNLQNLWNGDQNRDAPRPDLARDFMRAGARNEHGRGGDKRRNNGRQELAEQVAHRQEVENPQRSEGAHVLAIGCDLVLDRPDLGREIPVRDHDSFGLGRRSRGKDNFGDVIFENLAGRRRSFASALLCLRERPGGNLAGRGYGRDTISQKNQARVDFALDLAEQTG